MYMYMCVYVIYMYMYMFYSVCVFMCTSIHVGVVMSQPVPVSAVSDAVDTGTCK